MLLSWPSHSVSADGFGPLLDRFPHHRCRVWLQWEASTFLRPGHCPPVTIIPPGKSSLTAHSCFKPFGPRVETEAGTRLWLLANLEAVYPIPRGNLFKYTSSALGLFLTKMLSVPWRAIATSIPLQAFERIFYCRVALYRWAAYIIDPQGYTKYRKSVALHHLLGHRQQIWTSHQDVVWLPGHAHDLDTGHHKIYA